MKEVTVCPVTRCWSVIVLWNSSPDTPLCPLFLEEHKSSLDESQFFDLWEGRCGTHMLLVRAAMICMPRMGRASVGPRGTRLLCCVLLLVKADHPPISHYESTVKALTFFTSDFTLRVCVVNSHSPKNNHLLFYSRVLSQRREGTASLLPMCPPRISTLYLRMLDFPMRYQPLPNQRWPRHTSNVNPWTHKQQIHLLSLISCLSK